MIIIHLTDSFYPTIGGLERAVQTLATWQVSQGHEVHVVTGFHPGCATKETTRYGVTVWRYKMVSQVVPGLLENPERPFHPTFKDPVSVKSLTKIFNEIKPDIVHGHGWSIYSGIPVAKKMGVPFFATARDYGYFCAVKQNLLNGKECSSPSLDKCVKHAATHYGALKGVPLALGLKNNVKVNNSVQWSGLSVSVTEAASGSKYEVNNMLVTPSMVPDTVLNVEGLRRPSFVPEGKYVAYVGGLYNEKGVGMLLQAQQELIKEDIIIPLMLVGMLKHDSPDFNLPYVHVETDQPHDVVMSVWKHATVGVVPSLMPEAFGQVAVECLAAGTPAVVAAHGGLTDIVEDGIQGLWFTPGDVDDLKNKLKTLWLDEKRRTQMSTVGPSRAKQFTVSHVAPDIMKIYDTLVG